MEVEKGCDDADRVVHLTERAAVWLPPGATGAFSATSQQKANDDAQRRRRQERNDRLVGSKALYLVHCLPIGVLCATRGPVHLATGLRRRVAGHRAHSVLDFAPDVAGGPLDTIFINHQLILTRVQSLARAGEEISWHRWLPALASRKP